jgi:glycosyltransferase involved in cell wall biosynthesis
VTFDGYKSMKILFLDQSGKLGGAELSLLDVAYPYRHSGLVVLFQDGPFRGRLEQRNIPVRVLAQELPMTKTGDLLSGIKTLAQLLPLAYRVAHLARFYDVIYANTQKAMVVGALASALSGRPMVYHLRDILSTEHFSRSNLRLAIGLANRRAAKVICNSEATRSAFIRAGGHAKRAIVVYNGFDPAVYRVDRSAVANLRQELGLTGKFVVGHFSRLSPWKGQDVLLDALVRCPEAHGLFIGAALFGEDDYGAALRDRVQRLGLGDRVQFLGFRSDVAALMGACDMVAHTSTAPEPFGRVIVEAMLCGKPVIAAAAGGAVELLDGRMGWLVEPGNVSALADAIGDAITEGPELSIRGDRGRIRAEQSFSLTALNSGVDRVLRSIIRRPVAVAQTVVI